VQLNARVKDYHEAARSIQIVPVGAKWSAGTDWSLRIVEAALDRAASPDYGLGGPDDKKAAAYALLGCDNFKLGQKEHIKRLKAALSQKAEGGRGAIRREHDGISDLQERRAELSRLLSDAEAAAASLEASCKREAEAGEARLRDGANDMSRAESLRNEKRAALAAAQAAARELSPSVLGELAAAIRHSILAQERERDAIKDVASRMALRVTEHTQRVKSMLEHAAATVITAKNRQVAVEAERGARIHHVTSGQAFATGGPGMGAFAGAFAMNASFSAAVPPSPFSARAGTGAGAGAGGVPSTPSSAASYYLPAIPAPSLLLPSMPSFASASSASYYPSAAAVLASAARPAAHAAAPPMTPGTAAAAAAAGGEGVGRAIPFGSPAASTRSRAASAAKQKTPGRA
jgi:hypothetical protein